MPLKSSVSHMRRFTPHVSYVALERAKGFEPLTTCLGIQLGNDTMRYVRTQYATGSQQYQVVPVTERYRPQQQDTGATVTQTGKFRWEPCQKMSLLFPASVKTPASSGSCGAAF